MQVKKGENKVGVIRDENGWPVRVEKGERVYQLNESTPAFASYVKYAKKTKRIEAFELWTREERVTVEVAGDDYLSAFEELERLEQQIS